MVIQRILDESIAWEEKRSYWHFLFQSGRRATLLHALVQALRAKARVPFDLIVEITSAVGIEPNAMAISALRKGLRKQSAQEEIIGPTGWDKFDPRLVKMREELVERKMNERRAFKDNLLEKFEFLQSQRMTEQAGRVLRRMVQLYPENTGFKRLKQQFDEQWARDVLSTHLASLSNEKMDRVFSAPSPSDEEMLKCFAKEGEVISLAHREFAADLALGFWFMEDYPRALEALAWAPPSRANDWLRAELLFAGRRFIEALDWLNILEVKYVQDPETTFAVSYLRAQCLRESGQEAPALEILQSIVRVRPNYRSTNALLQEWTEGVSWE
jgi:hypothetical protein